MKPNCEHCGDTGRLAGSAFFDCGHCDVAQERVELATFVQDFCANYSGMAELLPEDLNYAIYQRGVNDVLQGMLKHEAPTRIDAINAAAHAIHTADAAGLVLTVSQLPRQPLAMGNYSTRVEVREKLER